MCLIFDQLFDQLLVSFNQWHMLLFRSVVFDIRSVVCLIFDQLFDQLFNWLYSISCTCYLFDQLCLIFNQLLVSFNQLYMLLLIFYQLRLIFDEVYVSSKQFHFTFSIGRV